MPDTIIRIDSAPIRMSVSSAPVRLGLFAAQGPAGPAGPNVVNASTASNGTANLSVSSLTTVTGSVSGIFTAPTAVTLTSTTQVATTAFVQQELAAGTAVAKNLEFLARNQSGSLIAKGSIVYISGATGNKPLITLAQANNDANSAQTIGFVKTDIAHNGTGYVIVRGEVESVKTFGATEGQQLYLSPTTAGAFTTTKPSAPQHLVYVGIVIAASTGAAFNGIILVAIQNGYELEELHDVLITSPAAKQVVKRNAGNTLWINEAIAASDVTGLGTLATQSGTFSGDSSGTNTGDQDLSNLLSRRTILEVNGTNAPISQSLVEQGYLSNGRRVWANGDGGTLLYDGASWFLTQLDPDSLVVYDAFKTSGSYEPWLLTGWTVTNGSGEPTFVLDPAEPLGNGVILALDLPADTNGGFLTAGTGGTLPIERGGTGATTAGLARTALGSGGIGDPLFRANNIAELDAAMGITTVKKTPDQTLIGTGLTNVISFPVVANVKYRIWGELILQSTITSVGFVSELWFPVPDTVLGSGVMGWMMQTNGAVTGIQLLTTTRSNWLGAYSGAAAVRRLPFDFTTRFTTSGTVSIACAQRTLDAANPSYCKTGTYMKYQIIDA